MNFERFRPPLAAAYSDLVRWGLDPRQTLHALRGIPIVWSQRRLFETQRRGSQHPEEFPMGRSFAIYGDRFAAAGTASGHYFHQDLLVAREVFLRAPRRHIDVGSAFNGFVAHVASFRTIEVMDVRPLEIDDSMISFIQQDLMSLNASFFGVTDSLSCLHALEHFGLGRYGDPVDYDGWRKGLRNLTNMLEVGGILYLSLPTGQVQRVEFNAHRVFAMPFLRDTLLEDFTIERLAFVDDRGSLIPQVDPFGQESRVSFRARYGCSIWVLRKRP